MFLKEKAAGVKRLINVASRKALPESVRKRVVVDYYQLKTLVGNVGHKPAKRTADELLSWRDTLSLRADYSREAYRGNVFYGAGKAIRDYSHAKACVKACIEHGLYYDGYRNDAELDGSELPALITFSAHRLRKIRELSRVPVLTIGPYIHYADSYISQEELASVKAALGKVLLVFPGHSLEDVERQFDMARLVHEIKELQAACNADTVLVSLYYRDILNGSYVPYEDAGFRVVTSGYREDDNFLPRQKSLIQLADYTASNCFGTHVGYCLYLGKPHYIISQKHSFVGTSNVSSRLDKPVSESITPMEDEVVRAFSTWSPTPTDYQLEICDRYWGFSSVRTEADIALVLDALEAAYQSKRSERQKALIDLVESASGKSERLRTLIDVIFDEG